MVSVQISGQNLSSAQLIYLKGFALMTSSVRTRTDKEASPLVATYSN